MERKLVCRECGQERDRYFPGIPAETCEVLEGLIIAWAEERGIFRHSDPWAQWEKTGEEYEELGTSIVRKDSEGIIDGIGDILVTLIIQAAMHDLSIEACLAYAWGEIKDRKGQMVDGVFVKEEEDRG